MKHSRSSLFLMELIIAILFFSLAGTVCIQLFAKSHILSRETVDQNHAVNWAQNLAEGYLGTEGVMEELSKLFPDAVLDEDGNVLTLFWDSKWQALLDENASDAAYMAVLKDLGYSAQTGLISADISVSRCLDGSEIYSLHVDHHIPERRR